MMTGIVGFLIGLIVGFVLCANVLKEDTKKAQMYDIEKEVEKLKGQRND